MKRLAVLAISGVFFATGPVAVAPAQTGDTEQRQDDSDFPWGLLGLLGLAGLAGLKKRENHDHDRSQRPGSTAGRV